MSENKSSPCCDSFFWPEGMRCKSFVCLLFNFIFSWWARRLRIAGGQIWRFSMWLCLYENMTLTSYPVRLPRSTYLTDAWFLVATLGKKHRRNTHHTYTFLHQLCLRPSLSVAQATVPNKMPCWKEWRFCFAYHRLVSKPQCASLLRVPCVRYTPPFMGRAIDWNPRS